MKAIILAAGKGTRLRPLTNTTPKPLIKILGKPIVEYSLESIYEHVDEIIIIVQYLQEQIRNYFGNAYHGTPITYHEQGSLPGTGGALMNINIDDKVLIISGDSIFSPKDLHTILSHSGNAVLVQEVENPEKYGIFTTNNRGEVQEVIEKPQEFVGNLANLGVYLLNTNIKESLENLPLSCRGEYEFTDAINRFIENHILHTISVTEPVLDISTPDDILQANKSLLGSQFKSPMLGDFYPLEKFEDYTIGIGIPNSQIDAIIKYSTDSGDRALMENTSDSKRFPNKEKLTSWYYDEGRIVVSMVSSRGKIAGFWQGRPSKAPIIETITNPSLYTELERNTNNIHTSGIRIYPAFRGKGLAGPLLKLSHLYYQKIYPHFYMSIDIDTNNIASQKSFEKLGYQSVGYGENQKTVEANKEPRIVYVYKNNPN